MVSQTLLEILKYTLPSLITFGAVYYILDKYLQNDYNKKLLDNQQQSKNQFTPIRLQAYERLILFLERITPNNLLMRQNLQNKSALELQNTLLTIIRQEYEHNITQQIYVSNAAWDILKNAKEETIRLINLSAAQLPENANALDLSKLILETLIKTENTPSQIAINYLKKEIRQLF